jgi:DnaB-like helicase C terminal domain
LKQLIRLIAPKWLDKPVIEGELTEDEIADYNATGYNIFYRPNYPSTYTPGTNINGTHIDTFEYVFVDYDAKSNIYPSKEHFLEVLDACAFPPTRIVDSGNGIHAYWRVLDLDGMSYLRLQRRLVRQFNTDEATCGLAQLMRLPGTFNTKDETSFKLCEILKENTANTYTCEQLDQRLPKITAKDEEFCQTHYNRSHGTSENAVQVDDKIPTKFGKLMKMIPEVKELWTETKNDRSGADFRLGHIMFANGFTQEEARSVLVNTAKALQRAPVHRVSYADNIVGKIWTFEEKGVEELSDSVKGILQKSNGIVKGTPFRCHPSVDNTVHGFRLGQVIGLVAGSGVGKTAFALNMFKWFAETNPDYHHFFVSLEQPANEIADRWQTMCGSNTSLHDKVHVLSNYDSEGNFRNLSLHQIQEYIVKWQTTNNSKVGCIVIDHIGALKKKGANDEKQDLITICHSMKAFAVQTNTLLIMQSQTSREKAGIGDLELNKDAAYGTSTFEWYCDYLVTLWQPLKRCHKEQACPTVTAFKFCKIRHKKARRDVIQEDVPYFFFFDSETELLRDMTQDEETSFNYFLPKATNKRKADRKTELVEYVSVPYKEGGQRIGINFISNPNQRRH